MSRQTESPEQASIRQYCKIVRTPAVAANFIPLAEQAIKEQHSHVRYLEALLAMECEKRDRHAIANRIREAQLPRMKNLEEFDFEKHRKFLRQRSAIWRRAATLNAARQSF